MLVTPVFCADWNTKPRTQDEAERYVADEIRRLVREGSVVLLAILSLSVEDECRMIALRMLTENVDPDGSPLLEHGHVWRLRLKDSAKPPLIDAQGRRLPKEKAGKVLITKVGNLGGQRAREDANATSLAWSGDRRNAKAATGQDIYVQREVTAKPAAYSLQDAVFILQQWGVGVQTRQYRRSSSWKPNDASEDLPLGQDQWLVEEMPLSPAPKS